MRYLGSWFVGAALLLLVLQSGHGQDKKFAPPPTAPRIDFSVLLAPNDPFQSANKPEHPTLTFDPTQGIEVVSRGAGWPLNHYRFRRGEAFTLTIVGIPKKDYYTYPATQRTRNQTEDGLNRVSIQPIAGVTKVGPLHETDPEFAMSQNNEIVLEQTNVFSLAQDFLIANDAEPGQRTLRFGMRVQVCDHNSCVIGTYEFAVPFVILPEQAEDKPVFLTEVPGAPAIKVVEIPSSVKDKLGAAPKPSPTSDSQSLGAESYWSLIVSTMGYAIVMLFTPCVFPMIPVTVSFFLHQAEKKHGSAVPLALVYSGTIIALLTLAVLSLGSVIISLASHIWLNLAFGLLLLTFALSLFGMFEIELPSFLTRYTAAHEGKGGLIGAFFMALTFTITSFTCTGPLLGVVLAPAAQASFGFGKLLLIALTYSTTFAAPFFLLALFPGVLKQLPRSGGWLNAVKVLMGFLEVAFAFKFLGIADAGLFPGNPRVFTYDTVLCSWIALSVVSGLYLLGFIRLPHDTPLPMVGVPRLLLAILLFSLAIYMAPALWRQNPKGAIGEFVVSFLPKDSGGDEGWLEDYEAARKEAIAKKKPLFIDFTGVTCQNCRWNELNVFTQAAVRDELKNYVLLRLYTDRVPDRNLSPKQSEEQGRKNRELQGQTFGTFAQPLYVVFQPDDKEGIVDGKLQGKELARHAGIINDTPVFVQKVLKEPSTKVGR